MSKFVAPKFFGSFQDINDASVEEIIANDCSITSFEGIERFPNLRYLELKNSNIMNFYGAKEISTLKSINLSDCPVANLQNFQAMALLAFGFSLTEINGKEIDPNQLAVKSMPNLAQLSSDIRNGLCLFKKGTNRPIFSTDCSLSCNTYLSCPRLSANISLNPILSKAENSIQLIINAEKKLVQSKQFIERLQLAEYNGLGLTANEIYQKLLIISEEEKKINEEKEKIQHQMESGQIGFPQNDDSNLGIRNEQIRKEIKLMMENKKEMEEKIAFLQDKIYSTKIQKLDQSIALDNKFINLVHQENLDNIIKEPQISPDSFLQMPSFDI